MVRGQRDRRERERGQILVLFTFVIIILMGFAALVIDVGVLRRTNQELWNAMDAGALAGAEELPASGANAASVGRHFANVNFPGIAPGDIDVSYRCVVGDRNNDGVPDAGDIPSVCDRDPVLVELAVCERHLRRAMRIRHRSTSRATRSS